MISIKLEYKDEKWTIDVSSYIGLDVKALDSFIEVLKVLKPFLKNEE